MPCASTSSEPFVKSHVTGTGNAATNLGSPVISSPALKTTELQLNKTETNSVKKPEDQTTLSLMATESPVLNRNATFSSGLNLTSDPRKAVEISKATLVSPVHPIYILKYFHQLTRRMLLLMLLLSSLRSICFCLSRLWWDLRQNLA